MKVDNWMQYYDVIPSPRWRTAANMKIVMSNRHISVNNDPIMTKFGTLNHVMNTNDLPTNQIFKFIQHGG